MEFLPWWVQLKIEVELLFAPTFKYNTELIPLWWL